MEKTIIILESSLNKYLKKCIKANIIIINEEIVVIDFKKMISLTISIPEDESYKLLGMIEWKDDLNCFMNYYNVPEKYNNIKTINCDHCMTNRNRKKGYVIENKITKVQMIVGKSCLDNYIAPNICSSIIIFEKLDNDDYKMGSIYLLKIELVARIFDEVNTNGFKSKDYGCDSTSYKIERSIDDNISYEYDKNKFKPIYDEIYKYYLEASYNNFNSNLVSILNLETTKNIDPFDYLGLLSAGVGIFLKNKQELLSSGIINTIILEPGKYEEEVTFYKKFNFQGFYGTQWVYQFITKEKAVICWTTAKKVDDADHLKLDFNAKLILKYTVKSYDDKFKNNKILRSKIVKFLK